MLIRFKRWLKIGHLALLLAAPASPAEDARYPLEPLDLSSPQATLSAFLSTGDRALSLLHGDHWASPTRESSQRLAELLADLEQTLDLSQTAPAARWDVGRDAVFHLYEVLSRIELPVASDIPGTVAPGIAGSASLEYGGTDGSGVPLSSWTIPHTEITLIRIDEGPRQGAYLFSPFTVAHAKEFYEKARGMPYNREVPLEGYADMRPYLSPLGWMVSSATIEEFPDWLKRDAGGNAWWKLIVIIAVLGAFAAAITLVRAVIRRRVAPGSSTSYLGRLVTPAFLLFVPSLIVWLNHQLTMAGVWSAVVQLLAEALYFIALAWLLWGAMLALAEAAIASRYIRERSLNAQLVRLVARALGAAIVLGVMLHLSNRLGAPLYSLVAGVGVGGIILALAVRPTLENFIGGLVLVSDKPVRIGDYCRFGDEYGTVEDIGMRSTRIRKRDDTLVTVPNSTFSQLQLTNYDRRRRRLYDTVLGLRYETTPEQLRYVVAQLRGMLIAHPKVSSDQLHVRFVGFGAYSLDIRLFAYIRTRDWLNYRAIVEDINLRVMDIVADAGTAFAFPSQTTYLGRDSGIDSERGRQAEAEVEEWRSQDQLPFPDYSEEQVKAREDSLEYPPKGSPDYKPPAA